jgi:hypothetical protein
MLYKQTKRYLSRKWLFWNFVLFFVIIKLQKKFFLKFYIFFYQTFCYVTFVILFYVTLIMSPILENSKQYYYFISLVLTKLFFFTYVIVFACPCLVIPAKNMRASRRIFFLWFLGLGAFDKSHCVNMFKCIQVI